jgi:carboxyl-terminal processing protease
MIKLVWIVLLFTVTLSQGPSNAQTPRPTPPARRQPPTPAAAPPRDPITSERKTAEFAKIREDFSEALATVEKHYIDGNKLNYNDLFKSSIIGALRSLDPHSNFYDAKEWEEQQAEWRSEYFGIGATIGDRRVTGLVNTYVLATFPDSPALKAGLRFGDKIVEVNGQAMHGKTSAQVRDVLRGARGTPVKITIERARDGQRQTVEVIRNAVPQPSVPDAYLIRPSVGYVAMTQGFNRTTADEFERAFRDLQARGITSLVIDLRNNGGGLLDAAIRVAEQFLQSDELVMTQRGRAVKREFKSQNLKPARIPLIVLVNRGTASAAEVAAGAWQDHDRALIAGEITFGKGLVQSIMPLDHGTALTLTTSKYQTPSGRVIQRDYSKGLYDYIFDGGLGTVRSVEKPSGPEFRTGMGRPIYSGNGITPDEVVKARTLSPRQVRLFDPVFAFARELVNGRIKGFDSYATQNAIDFDHDIIATDFPVTDELFEAFKKFAASDPAQKLTPKHLDAERAFIGRQLRYDIATAFYGTTKAARVLIADDPQVLHAIEALPRAAALARAAAP